MRMAVLALASIDGVLSLPGQGAPPLPTITARPRGALKKRQDSGDIVASYGDGSVLSKLNSDNAPQATAPNSFCTGIAQPQQGIGQGCECDGASPTYVPVNSVNGDECAYTTVAGTYGGATSPPPSSSPTPTSDQDTNQPPSPTPPPPSPTPTSDPNLNQPCTETDTLGVEWVFPSATIGFFGHLGFSLTMCAGDATAVSTIASLVPTSSSATPSTTSSSAAPSNTASSNPYFTNGFCGFIATEQTVGAPEWRILIPKWLDTFSLQAANNDFRGALYDHNHRCSGFVAFKSGYGGPNDDTYLASFATSVFCTAWEMTQVIRKATHGKYAIPCHSITGTEGFDFHPESGEVPPGESGPKWEIDLADGGIVE